MDVQQYLKRLKYKGDIKPNFQLLQQLQKNHLLIIPFENLDIHYEQAIILSLDHFYKKIVLRRRGGYCYELNGLFGELLRQLGFEVKMISARVYQSEKGYGPEFDHLALVIHLDGRRYLVDFGFGEFAFSPLLIELGHEQEDSRGQFKIDRYDGDRLLVSQLEEEGWVPAYSFILQERQLSDFEDMNHSQQHHPDSHFRKGKMISRPTLDGRITLTDKELKIKRGKDVHKKPIDKVFTFEWALKQYFDLLMR